MLMEGHVLQVAGAAPQPHTRPWPGCATQKWGAQILGSWVRGLGGRGDILASGGRDPARSRAVAPSAGGRTSRARDAWPAGPVPRVCTCARTRARLPSCARTRTRAHARLRACDPSRAPTRYPPTGTGRAEALSLPSPSQCPPMLSLTGPPAADSPAECPGGPGAGGWVPPLMSPHPTELCPIRAQSPSPAQPLQIRPAV